MASSWGIFVEVCQVLREIWPNAGGVPGRFPVGNAWNWLGDLGKSLQDFFWTIAKSLWGVGRTLAAFLGSPLGTLANGSGRLGQMLEAF